MSVSRPAARSQPPGGAEDNLSGKMDNSGTTNMSADLKFAIDQNFKKRSIKQSSLTQAKDRAQIAATTAMSIGNVALLKACMDQGPEWNPYYKISIGLISTCLVMQVIAGVLSIWVSQLIGYMEKYGGNVCEDIRENLCPFQCIRQHDEDSHQGKRKNMEGVVNLGVSTDTPGELDPRNVRRRGDGDDGSLDDTDDDKMDECCSCCGYGCTTEVYHPYEHRALRKYYEWQKDVMDQELKHIRSTEEIDYLTALVEKDKATIKTVEETMKAISEKSEKAKLIDLLEKTRQDMSEAQERRKKFEARMTKTEILRQQGRFLADYAKSVRKNRVMKMATFYQHGINYILYTVFVLNAFIAGFGFTANPAENATGASAVNASITKSV